MLEASSIWRMMFRSGGIWTFHLARSRENMDLGLGFNNGLQRLLAVRKARIWRGFVIKESKFSENRTAWLATQC